MSTGAGAGGSASLIYLDKELLETRKDDLLKASSELAATKLCIQEFSMEGMSVARQIVAAAAEIRNLMVLYNRLTEMNCKQIQTIADEFAALDKNFSNS